MTDPQLPTAGSLPRSQFLDHVPQFLDGFEQVLRLAGSEPGEAATEGPKTDAAAHGLQRWQQGYDLREVTIEWARLHLCLSDELERYQETTPDVPLTVMSTARHTLTKLCGDGISESTSKYYQLQQCEAAGHVRDLAMALEELRQLERQRGVLWQQAAHDLRGNLGVVVNATEVLGLVNETGDSDNAVVRSLQKSVSSLHAMLDDVLSLARLQAGQEHCDVRPFDAAKLIRELCHNVQPLAVERGLSLHVAGDESLPVEGDSVKTFRIVQNLLLNALKYTHEGGVVVSWSDSRSNDGERWMLTIADSGPGFHAGPGAPMVQALEEATDEARIVDAKAGKGPAWDEREVASAAEKSRPDPRPVHQEAGEGIGLSIVKRLCELLLASVEVESTAGKGTTFRVMFPRRYHTTAE